MSETETNLLHLCERCCEEEWINDYYRICHGCIIKEEREQEKEEAMYDDE